MAFLTSVPVTTRPIALLPVTNGISPRAPSPSAPLTHSPHRRVAPRMVEQTTIVAVATILAGVGAGFGLVAWTENQGELTTARENLQPCVECNGDTTTICNVCNGSKADPLDESKTCSYCEGIGAIKCFNCAGSGVQPRFLDRLSPDDFMD